MTPLVEARGLTKKYKHVRALDGLDLVASDGHVVALLGPNGSGKTTFVRSVATLLRPDAGTLHVAGVDALKRPNDVRRLIGLAGQYAAVEPTMTGRENLEMIARLFGHRARAARLNADAVLERLGLVEAADRRVKTYSGGMRRKLDLGASLVGAPKLLLLDEPTTGLDPRSRIELWDTIRDLVSTGTDVLLTTQYLDEADQLAQEIVIIDHGRVIAAGTPDELKSRAGQDVVEIHARDANSLGQLANALAPIGSADPRIDEGTRRLAIAVDEGPERLTEVVGIVGRLGIAIDDVALRRPTLDEVFLALTGKAPTDIDAATDTAIDADETHERRTA
jgi:ABC-2 type transport system ATP-binding protein